MQKRRATDGQKHAKDVPEEASGPEKRSPRSIQRATRRRHRREVHSANTMTTAAPGAGTVT